MQKLLFSLAFLFGACSPDAVAREPNRASALLHMIAPTADCVPIAEIKDGTSAAVCKIADEILWINVSPYEQPKMAKIWEAPRPAPTAPPKVGP